MNIGLTIDVSISPKNSTTNQAILLIADIFARSGHKCFLITNRGFNVHRNNACSEIMSFGHFLARFDPHEKSPIPLDVCVELGFLYEPDVAKELKKKNPTCKFIFFCLKDQCTIDNLASTTNFSYGPKRLIRQFDEVWTWQHLTRTLPYLEATYGCKARAVPFLWDSKFIHKEIKALNNKKRSPAYSSDRPNAVSILEENKNPHATCLIPLAICERLNHKHPDLIEKLNITNCESLKKNQHFQDLIANLSICKTNPQKVFFNNKWNNADSLSRWGKVVVCNSMLGDLSARHLEFVYLEYPLLHNIESIKDFAYYYDVRNLKNAVSQLRYALTMHDTNLDYYKGQMKECLHKFSAHNQNNINAFNQIL